MWLSLSKAHLQVVDEERDNGDAWSEEETEDGSNDPRHSATDKLHVGSYLGEREGERAGGGKRKGSIYEE